MVLVMPLQKPRVNPMSATPIYEQLVQHLADSIARGDLAAGEKLPPRDQLAEEWEVGRSTMARAWQEAASRGVIDVRQGKGTFAPEAAE
jgi:DNA-binding GntR family transcriptional regulator